MKEERQEEKQLTSVTIFSEVQMILAEKRTALASLRTGIAVFALPLSVLGLLVATSRYYDPNRVLYFLVPLLALSVILVFLGSYLVIHSLLRIHRYDRLIERLKRQYRGIADLLV